MPIIILLEELTEAYTKDLSDCVDGLLPPASEETIREVEGRLGQRIPNELRELWRVYGGQKGIGPGITGLFGQHRLHSPHETLERHQMNLDNCLQDPLPEFPPHPGTWGYWIPDLIPFASWDAYDLCIHSHYGDVWEFNPYTGLTKYQPSIAAVLNELIHSVKSGRKPVLPYRSLIL
jgi:hypothetical protein